jgi:hypothetical protein
MRPVVAAACYSLHITDRLKLGTAIQTIHYGALRVLSVLTLIPELYPHAEVGAATIVLLVTGCLSPGMRFGYQTLLLSHFTRASARVASPRGAPDGVSAPRETSA